MRVGLICFDGRIPNLALMRLSSHYKKQGHTVILNNFRATEVDKVFCSVIFEKNRMKAERLKDIYPNIEFGGTGWELCKTLPDEVEAEKPDYNLYTMDTLLPRVNKGYGTKESKIKKAQVLLDAGIGFTTRGCPRQCAFCVVPNKEGKLRKVGSIGDLVNPRSRVVIILDNNFTADPDVLEKLREIKERGLTVDLTQGVDARAMTEEIAKALSEVKHLRSIHYAWDSIDAEQAVFRGINMLKEHIKAWRHLCYILVGFDSTFEQDMYRYHKLWEHGIHPYVMVYNQKNDIRLQKFARFINGRFHKAMSFEEYEPWVKARASYVPELFASAA